MYWLALLDALVPLGVVTTTLYVPVVVAGGMVTVSEAGDVTVTLVPFRTRFWVTLAPTKFTQVDPASNPAPFTCRVPPPVTGPLDRCVVVFDTPVTVGELARIRELLMVMPVPHVPAGGAVHGARLILGLCAE
jgi:hypothetical protein